MTNPIILRNLLGWALLSIAFILSAPLLLGQTASDFRGQVIDEVTRFGIEGAQITLDALPADSIAEFALESDWFGFFSASSVPAANYRLRATHPGYRSFETNWVINAGAAPRPRIVLAPLAPDRFDLSFEIVDVTTGLALGATPVQLERFLSANDAVAGEVLRQVSDVNGEVVFRGLASGWYGFRVNDGSFTAPRPKWDALTSGLPAGQHAFLNKSHAANARLKPQKQNLNVNVLGFHPARNQDNQPLEGVFVEVTGVDPLDPTRPVMPPQTSVTDNAGRAAFSGLPAIAYRVTAKKLGYTPDEVVIQPDADGNLPAATLTPALKPTHLFVLLQHPYTHSNFVAGLRVDLEGMAGTPTEGIRRAQLTYDNRFPRQRAFFNLMPGNYRVKVNGVTFSGPPGNTLPRFIADEQVDVIEGVWTDLDLPLAVEPARVRGRLLVANEMAETTATESGFTAFAEAAVYQGEKEISVQIVEYAGDGYLIASLRTNLVTTDDKGEFSLDLLPGRYGVKIPEMTNHWGRSIRLRNLSTAVNSEKSISRGWPFPDAWPHATPPPSNGAGDFGNPVLIRSGHDYQMDLFVEKQLISIIGQVKQESGNAKDSIFTGQATLRPALGDPIASPLVELTQGAPVFHFKAVPPGVYRVTFDAPHYSIAYPGGGASSREVVFPLRPPPGIIPAADPSTDQTPRPFDRVDLGETTASFIPSSTNIRVISRRFGAGGYGTGAEVGSFNIIARPDGWNSYLSFASHHPFPYGSFDYWISFRGGAIYPEFMIQGRINEGETKTHEIFWRGGPTDTPLSEYQQASPPVLPSKWTIRAVNVHDAAQILSNILTTATLNMISSNVVRVFSGEHIEPAWTGAIQVVSAANPNWVVDTIQTKTISSQNPEYLTLIKLRRGVAVRGVARSNSPGLPPLEGVRVVGRSRHGAPQAEASTDAAGAWSFAQELSSAPIYIDVDTPGYVPWRKRFTAADAVPIAGNDSQLTVEINLDPLPPPAITRVAFDRAGIFFPGLHRIGDITRFSPSNAAPALTLTWAMDAEPPPPLPLDLPAFDTRLGVPGPPLPPLRDYITELWMIDPRSFTNRALSGAPQPLSLPTEPAAWRPWLQRIAGGSISNLLYQRAGVPHSITNTVGTTNVVRLWKLPEGDFNPVFVALSKHGAVAVQTNFPYAEDRQRLRGVAMPPWLSFSSHLFSSLAAFLDNPGRVREISPQGRFVPRSAFTASIAHTPDGYLNYDYVLGLDWNEGIESPGTGFLQFFPKFMGAKMQTAMQFGLRGTNAEVYIKAEAKDTILDLESLFDNVPVPVTPIFKPSIDTTLRGSRQFTPVNDPFELEITDEAGIGFEIGATFEIEIQKVPLIGRVLRKLKLGGAAATAKIATELDSRRSWATRFPAARASANNSTPGLDQVFRRHFAGGREETSHLWDLCLFSQASVTAELPFGAAGAEGGVKLVGANCVHGRPTAKLTINPDSDWPYVTGITGTMECFLEPKVSLWFKEIGYFLTWPFFDFSYPYSTDPLFQLIPMDLQRRSLSPSSATPATFIPNGETRVSNLYAAGDYAAASSPSGQLLAFTDPDPLTGQMRLQVARRDPNAPWQPPVTIAVASGIVDVALTSASGEWFAVWTQVAPADADNPFPPSRLMFSRGMDGVEWTPPALLAELQGVAAELRLASIGHLTGLAFLETPDGPLAEEFALKTSIWNRNTSAWDAPKTILERAPVAGFALTGVMHSSEPAFQLLWLEAAGRLRSLAGPPFDPASAKNLALNATAAFDADEDGAGSAYLAWLNTDRQITLARWSNSEWQPFEPVLNRVMASQLELVREDSRLLLAWSEGAPASLRYAWLDPSGRSLQPPTALALDPTQDQPPAYGDLSLSLGPDGRARLFARRQTSAANAFRLASGPARFDGTDSLLELSLPFGNLVRLQNPRLTPDGTFSFELTGVPGTAYRVQFSSDLKNWADLRTVRAENQPLLIREPPPNAATGFYRVLTP